LLGELQHGAYDDCEGLTEEEVNAFYGFNKDGESWVVDEDMGQSEAQDSDDSDDDGHSEEFEVDAEQDEQEDADVIDQEDGFHTEVCHLSNH